MSVRCEQSEQRHSNSRSAMVQVGKGKGNERLQIGLHEAVAARPSRASRPRSAEHNTASSLNEQRHIAPRVANKKDLELKINKRHFYLHVKNNGVIYYVNIERSN